MLFKLIELRLGFFFIFFKVIRWVLRFLLKLVI